jgi:hypothetical protein
MFQTGVQRLPRRAAELAEPVLVELEHAPVPATVRIGQDVERVQLRMAARDLDRRLRVLGEDWY